jgi:monoamine oxidase
MLSCARATRGLGRPSLGLMARFDVPVGGRVKNLRAVGDQPADPQGRMMERAHSRLNQAALEKQVGMERAYYSGR